LLKNGAKKVIAVEFDKRATGILYELQERYGERLEIIQGDALRVNYAEIAEREGGKIAVCANLPYNITSPAISVFIESGLFETITVMVQREVARRICAVPGSPDYSAFTVYTNYHTEPRILFDVPPECFIPRPRVYSSVLTMKKREERYLNSGDEEIFFRVVRAAFGQRRKTLVNSLYSVFGSMYDKTEISRKVENCGFTTLTRGETLGIEEFIRLSEHFKQK